MSVIKQIEIRYHLEKGVSTLTHLFEPPITDTDDDRLAEAEDILLGITNISASYEEYDE